MMNRWYGIALFLAALLASIAIRVPHDKRSKATRVAESRKGSREIALLALMFLAVLGLPLLYVATPVLSFADYTLEPLALAVGAMVVIAWLWLFYRSHADLGPNWSVTLEVREHHQMVTSGVYRMIRHPMYAAIFLHAIAQAFLLANWIAGPATFVAFTLMFALRLRPEEQLMRDRFGADYDAYIARTKRLIPGVW